MKKLLTYTITGKGGVPEMFKLLGFLGAPKLTEDGENFTIVGKRKAEEEEIDVDILKESLMAGISRCKCTDVNIEITVQ